MIVLERILLFWDAPDLENIKFMVCLIDQDQEIAVSLLVWKGTRLLFALMSSFSIPLVLGKLWTMDEESSTSRT